MRTLRPRVFKKDEKAQYLQYLNQHGYAVIGDILPEELIPDLINKFWDAWEYVSPQINRNDKTTWTIANSPMMFAKGIAAFSGLSHSEFMWLLRLRPEIKEIFTTLHGTNDLCVSFDGFSVFFDKKQKTKPWWHIDQNKNNPIYCVQGAYNFFPVNENSAGFTIVPGSHSYTNIPEAKGDWVLMDKDPITENGVKLLIPGNSFTLWISRAIHANTGMTDDEIRFDRLTCYITFLPKTLRSAEVLEEKKEAYKNGETTSHWANKCEIKKYPWGFGPQYERKNFKRILPPLPIPQNIEDLF